MLLGLSGTGKSVLLKSLILRRAGGAEEIEGVPPQIQATPGLPKCKAVARRQAPSCRPDWYLRRRRTQSRTVVRRAF